MTIEESIGLKTYSVTLADGSVAHVAAQEMLTHRTGALLFEIEGDSLNGEGSVTVAAFNKDAWLFVKEDRV